MLAQHSKLLEKVGMTFIVAGGVLYLGGPFLPDSPLIALAAITSVATGLLILAVGHRASLFTADGFILSLPTALMFLTLIIGLDPGDSNNAFLVVWLVFFVLILPWSIGAFMLGWFAGAGHNAPLWWSLPLFALSCLVGIVGAHINGSFIGQIYRQIKQDV